mmetsp:Transcript_32971/g.105208  ORF Transcript_32971/g.105208 Transcript_32971/m.105208 type:complete len:213 (+) Transcript_32971:246-884(+)
MGVRDVVEEGVGGDVFRRGGVVELVGSVALLALGKAGGAVVGRVREAHRSLQEAFRRPPPGIAVAADFDVALADDEEVAVGVRRVQVGQPELLPSVAALLPHPLRLLPRVRRHVKKGPPSWDPGSSSPEGSARAGSSAANTCGSSTRPASRRRTWTRRSPRGWPPTFQRSPKSTASARPRTQAGRTRRPSAPLSGKGGKKPAAGALPGAPRT